MMPHKKSDSVPHKEQNPWPTGIIAVGALLIGLSFVNGYFWGIHDSVEQLSSQLEQEAFADQISASLIPMHGVPYEEHGDTEKDVVVAEQEVLEEQEQFVSDQSYLRTYYAQLAGFGSKRSAQKFAQKLERQNIPVIVNAIHSKNARGKSVTWYQVVTESYSTKEELESVVERLKETERLKNPQIVHC